MLRSAISSTVLLLLLVQSTFATIHQVRRIEEIFYFLNRQHEHDKHRSSSLRILSFWDVDETIIVPNTTFIEGVAKPDAFIGHISTLYPPHVLNAMMLWMEHKYYDSSVRLVEPMVPSTLFSVSRMGQAFALTSRGIDHKYTPDMMRELRKTVLHMFDQRLCGPGFNAVPFDSGVFFVNEGDKGKAIGAYLDHCGIARQDNIVIVHVDNTLSKCQDVERELMRRGIEHLVFHYTAIEHQISDHAMLMQFADLIKDLIPNQ